MRQFTSRDLLKIMELKVGDILDGQEFAEQFKIVYANDTQFELYGMTTGQFFNIGYLIDQKYDIVTKLSEQGKIFFKSFIKEPDKTFLYYDSDNYKIMMGRTDCNDRIEIPYSNLMISSISEDKKYFVSELLGE